MKSLTRGAVNIYNDSRRNVNSDSCINLHRSLVWTTALWFVVQKYREILQTQLIEGLFSDGDTANTTAVQISTHLSTVSMVFAACVVFLLFFVIL
jgi:hypothetical protein